MGSPFAGQPIEGIDTPILFLTARNDGSDRVEGLRLGANDYLGKPLMEELLLRLGRLMDQAPTDAWTQLKEATIGEVRVDFIAFEAQAQTEESGNCPSARRCCSNC